MSGMIERVARAILTSWGEIGGMKTAWEDLSGFSKASALAQARAAITAMREPTDAMRDEVYNYFFDERGGMAEAAVELWRSQIDEALNANPASLDRIG